MKFKMRKDKLVNEENFSYIAFGMDIYEGWKKVRSIKDISFNRKRMKKFVKYCNHNKIHLDQIYDMVLDFVEDEYKITEEPCYPE